MASQNSISMLLGLVLLALCSSVTSKVAKIPSQYDTFFLNRSSFPRGFLFGTASSSYQFEGAWKEDGRGPSIWDTYTHKYPEKIKDRSNGDVATNEYQRYQEDVEIMKGMNLDAYRFSISWSRLLPSKFIYFFSNLYLLSFVLQIKLYIFIWLLFSDGKLRRGVNKEGINYYNDLINELLAKGLKPFVTIFHWDLPQALEDEYGGFLNPNIVNDFRDYAELCFKEFGDRVKHWITLNEPWSFSSGGYANAGADGALAPGRCSEWLQLNCTGGNSATEPYLVTHHQLLAHAAAVNLYKKKYQASQKGLIGITLVSQWFVPFANAMDHQNAALRAIDFMFGWFLDPLTSGNYPQSMRYLVGDRLPKFTKEQMELVKGSYDFLGLNYYTTNYAAHDPIYTNAFNASYSTDSRTKLSTHRNGIPIGPKAASDWLYVYLKGFYDLLLYVKEKYHNPLIYITENGIDEYNNPKLSLKEALIDTQRVDYYFRHLSYLKKAIKDGVNVKGYFAWSLLDNFEWASGYTVRFGFNFVDYENGQKRYPKLSAHWFKKFLKRKN
ncbi:hypothetical protein UlMin_030415 [Ulmus minor]